MTLRRTKPMRWMALLGTVLFSTLLLCPVGLLAQNNEDPPGRVARIRYLQGSVSFEPAGESDWVAAASNRPVTIGDQLWADQGSRAELDLGSAVVRMNADTGFSFLNLDDRTTQIQLTQGILDLRVRNLNQGEIFEIDTPNQAFSVTQPGEYRVEAAPDGGSTVVTVRQGQGEVTGGGQTYDMNSGQSGTFTGTGTDSLNGQLVQMSAPDDFDRWGELRDRQYDNSRSARYVSRDVVGYEDLDANGTWGTDPTYGNVWYPNAVPSGWAPYRDGRWVWVNPWGWTWVDDEPWGYAPFHYGRWASMHGRWGWVPGPTNVQPVYAPALVAFIGGPNFGISATAGQPRYGGGDVGWFPLGPREVYVPAYAASPGYVQRVNTSNTVVNTTTITNVYNTYNTQTTNVTNTNITYVNRTVPGAVTAVPANVLRSSAPVAKAAVPIDERRIAAAPVAPRAAVVPARESVLGTANPSAVHMARPPAAVANRTVVAKTSPPPPPVPFAKQQQELAKQPGRPLPVQQTRAPAATVATAHPAVKMAPPAKPASLKPVATSAGNAKPPANAAAQQQQAEQAARQQQAQQQAKQQQAEQAARQQQAQQQAAQQQAAQQQAEKARQQQAQQQAKQQQAEQQAKQQQAEQAARQQQAQQQAKQQQAEQTARQQQAQQQAAQQQAEKARQQQAQQQAKQQQAQQQAAQQQAQQQAKQQQAEQAARQQQAQQQAKQQQAEQAARQQQAQQQAAQQQAERAREQQLAQQRAQQPQARPAQPPPQQKPQPQAKPGQPQPPPKDEQKKPEEKQPPE